MTITNYTYKGSSVANDGDQSVARSFIQFSLEFRTFATRDLRTSYLENAFLYISLIQSHDCAKDKFGTFALRVLQI